MEDAEMQTKAKTTKAEDMGEPSGKMCKCGAEIHFHVSRGWVEGGGSATFVSEFCPAQMEQLYTIMKHVPTEPYWKYQETEEEVWLLTRQHHSDLDDHAPYYN